MNELPRPVCFLCGKPGDLGWDSICDAPAHGKCAEEAAVELRALGVHPGRWAKVVRGEEEP